MDLIELLWRPRNPRGEPEPAPSANLALSLERNSSPLAPGLANGLWRGRFHKIDTARSSFRAGPGTAKPRAVARPRGGTAASTELDQAERDLIRADSRDSLRDTVF